MTKKKTRLKPEAIPPGSEPWIPVPGMPTDTTLSDGVLPNRAELPFACRRCMYQLQVQRTHTLAKGGMTPVICLGTCLEVVKGNPEAIAELNLTDADVNRLGNSFDIPDHVIASALRYDIEKGASTDAAIDLVERALLPEGEEAAAA